MKTIFKHSVIISDDKGILKDKTEFRTDTLNVIGENKINIVVDDLYFTTIRKNGNKYSTCLEKENIHFAVNDSCYGNRISYTLYSERNVRASTIKAHIEAAIETKFGFFVGWAKLGIINENERVTT